MKSEIITLNKLYKFGFHEPDETYTDSHHYVRQDQALHKKHLVYYLDDSMNNVIDFCYDEDDIISKDDDCNSVFTHIYADMHTDTGVWINLEVHKPNSMNNIKSLIELYNRNSTKQYKKII